MNPRFAYALARLHAHLAYRPAAAERRRFEAIADFGHFVQAAGQGGFALWLEDLGPLSSAHQIEQALRRKLKAYLQRVGGWLPAAWRPLVAALSAVLDLPFFGFLQHHDTLPEWSSPDTVRWVEGHSAAPSFGRGADLAEAWLDASRRLIPATDPASRSALEALFRRQIVARDPAAEGHELARLFRRHRHPAVRIFAVLALARLEVEYLRGELLVRRLAAGVG